MNKLRDAMRPKLASLEDVTLNRVLGANAVRASDGYVTQVLWENPDCGATTDDLLIRVPEVTPAYVDPVRKKVCQVLIDSQHGSPAGVCRP
jgi:hypothetical protein